MTLLTDAESTEFENIYKRLLSERFGNAAITADDELGFCRELKRGAQTGDVPHGGELHHVVPADIDYTDPAILRAMRRPSGLSLPQLALLLALTFVFLTYAVMTLTGLNKPSQAASLAPTGTATATGSTLANRSITDTVATATLAPAPTVAAGFVTVAGEVLPTVRPNSLELAGRSFLVYVAPVRDGNWNVRQEPGIANWVPGSILNWSFALYLEAEPNAQTWLSRLQPGAAAILRVADGRAVPFNITEAREINRSQIEFLDPRRPGLTVAIKLKAGDSRLLLRGVEASAVPEVPGKVTPTTSTP
jgi:hypothetical protein